MPVASHKSLLTGKTWELCKSHIARIAELYYELGTTKFTMQLPVPLTEVSAVKIERGEDQVMLVMLWELIKIKKGKNVIALKWCFFAVGH